MKAQTSDVRNQPAYGPAEAARYLRLPSATLRTWLVGRDYPKAGSQATFHPLIAPARRQPLQLSFYNLVEAHVLRALRTEHGVKLPELQRHGDLFQPDGSDEQWLEHCGRLRRVAITHNSRICYVPNELAALIQFRVTLLVLVGKAPSAELATNSVRTLPRINAMLGRMKPPAILKVYRPAPAELAQAAEAAGRVEFWFPKTQ